MIKHMKLLFILCLFSFTSANAAIITYTIQGSVTNTDVIDSNGNSIYGKIADITFTYDDLLSRTSVFGTNITQPFSLSISVADIETSITSTNTFFDSWNDAYNSYSCSDAFTGYGNGFYFIFEEVRDTSDYCSTDLPTLLDGYVSAPEGAFNYETGFIRINDFGDINLRPVPLPASIWLFLSSFPMLLRFKRNC